LGFDVFEVAVPLLPLLPKRVDRTSLCRDLLLSLI
jgi:hypothetical protein